jgi:Flp pilus assembly protein TadD
VACIVAILAGVAFGFWLRRPVHVAAVKTEVFTGPVVADQRTVFATYAGSASCRECHSQAYADWAQSHHGLAERPLRAELDREAFDPPQTVRHGTQTTETRMNDGRNEVVTLGANGKVEPFAVARVIGVDPLRQFLVESTEGRMQTLEVAYDPHRHDWFDIYGDEDRKPGEWGHWTGRGMNWNSMCASCHNSRVRKNYDTHADLYRTAMAEMTVSCESCHGPMKAHVDWRKQNGASTQADPTLRKLSRDQMFDTCGSCHARRSEITGDFFPGEKFSDHFALTVVDDSDLYYPDGQVSGENYEYGSFLGSKMHAAGVRCVDCHQPHSAKTLATGDALCLRCHASSTPLPGITKPAPIIDPIAHGHHGADSTDASCVSCHMPVTNYMQRHARHDHGLTIPDPLLTKKLGIPNACNRCHQEKDADWSLAVVEQWFGAKMERPARRRAEIIAAARRGDDDARDHLLALAADQTGGAFWQASAAHLLDRWIGEPRVQAALLGQTQNASPLVCATAVQMLEPALESDTNLRLTLERFLSDPDRSVRTSAAWALRATLHEDCRAGAELQHMMWLNSDQPTGQMQLGVWNLARGDAAAAVRHFQKAVTWDPNSPPFHHEFAVALSIAGRADEARAQLQEAVRLDPRNAEYHYKLGLAWNETNRLDQTVAEMQRAVSLDARHARAWYNLGLAQHRLGQSDAALTSLQRGEAIAPTDPRLPYARATILAQLGRIEEARIAARRALSIQPDFPDAQQLLQTLGR